jgi:hypothetical protein
MSSATSSTLGAVPALLLALVLALMTPLLAGCGSPEDKVAAHIGKAKALMADEDYDLPKLIISLDSM